MIKKLLVYLLCFSIALPQWAWAGTTRNVTCSVGASPITTALQDAITASSDTDIVNISSGSCSSGPVSITDQAITVRGQGEGITTITMESGGFRIKTNDSSHASWRVSSMTIGGSDLTAALFDLDHGYNSSATAYNYGWRIDHITTNYVTQSADTFRIMGPTFGLLDHNHLSKPSGTMFQIGMMMPSATGRNEGNGPITNVEGAYSMSLSFPLGSQYALYFEDNVFTAPENSFSSFIDLDYGGARIVFRRNTFINGRIYAHQSRGSNAVANQIEIYDNEFDGDNALDGFTPVFLWEGGTGVYYNNYVHGWKSSGVPSNNFVLALGRHSTCGYTDSGSPLYICNDDPTHAWDGTADGSYPGWPCVNQAGRGFGKTMAEIIAGTKQPSAPIRAWHNGTTSTCRFGGTCASDASTLTSNCPGYISTAAHPNNDKDFCNGLNAGADFPATCGNSTLSYTALGYPHPLNTDAGDTTAPTITAFTIPATAISLNVPISSFTATDNVAVTGYCLVETNDSAGCSWVGSAPSVYTFSTGGAKTLYAFTKDAAGNISNSANDSVTITLPPPPAYIKSGVRCVGCR